MTDTSQPVAQASASPAQRGTVIVEVKDLEKHFTTPGGKPVPVLKDINLTLSEGEILALLGKSGAGKSTLLRCIAGLIAPTKGVALYRGRPVNGPSEGMAMVFQTFALLPWLDVRANVELGLEARAVPPRERRERAEQAIEGIGLKGFEDAYPRELSGGMRQRVDFARALVVRPEALLMDEPFSALDVLTADNLRTDLLEAWAGKDFPTKALLIVTHNIEEAVQMADRIILLASGPGKPHVELDNPLPRPRDRRSPDFEAAVDYLYAIMTGHTEAEAESGAASDREAASPSELPLPHASVEGLGGLVTVLGALGGHAELPRLAVRLALQVDDLLPLTDAAEMLGFATVENAQLELTPTGKQWAEAHVRTAKKIFGEQARRRAPLVRTIVHCLSTAEHGKLSEGFFLDLLERNFTSSQAHAQLHTAIAWGRYGRLYEYDADHAEFSHVAGG